MIMYGFTRRRDGSRRVIFAVGAAVVVPVIIIVVTAQQSHVRSDFTLARLLIGVPVWLAFVFGTLIAGMGWFGLARRVGDHPHCRRCGFDLFGKPPESTRCSECGADLHAKRAVVIGVAARRYKLLALSLFLLLLGVLVGGKPIYRSVTETNWQAYKPMWWLINDLNGPNARVADQEIHRRFNQQEVSASDVSTLVRHLARDTSGRSTGLSYLPLNWMIQHGGELDEEDVRSLIRVGSNTSFFRTVPTLARGMPIPLAIATIADYFKHDESTLTIHVQLNGIDLPVVTKQDNSGIRQVDPGPLWDKIPDGPVTLTAQVDAVVHFSSHGKPCTEPFTVKVSTTSTLATGAAAEAPTTRPTPTDLAAVWTATFGPPATTPDDARGLRIDCSGGSTRVVAHAILIDQSGQQDIGMVEGYPSAQVIFQAGRNFRRPVGKARLELVPAPEATCNGWYPTPILNQTIRIDQVTNE